MKYIKGLRAEVISMENEITAKQICKRYCVAEKFLVSWDVGILTSFLGRTQIKRAANVICTE